MARPHIEFIEAGDVPEEDATDGVFAGAPRRLLSADDTDGSWTGVVRLAGGARYDLSSGTRPLELFGLRGSLVLAGQEFHAGSYAYVPAARDDGSLSVTDESLVLVMAEPESDGEGGAAEVIDTNERRLEDHGVEGVPPGLVIKLLRVDEEKGDWTWICAGPPGWREDRAEIHPTVEEALVLRGDVLLGERGEMRPGSYFWRPPMVRHGPMYSRGGNLIFFRTKGGGMEVTYEEVPGWRALVEDYRSREPLYLGE
jgi:ChrR-like protein with cupin domain